MIYSQHPKGSDILAVSYMKKSLLTLLIGVFLVSFINAVSIGTFKQSEDVEIYQTCNNCTYCNFTKVKYSNGTSFLSNISATKENTYYFYNVEGENHSILGDYSYCYECGNVIESETGCLYYTITPTGFLLETSESILYIIILIVTFILFLGFLYPAITLPYSNNINPDGSITRITKTKYLKLLSVWFAYGFFMWFLQTLNGISSSFIKLTYLSNFITNIFTYSQLFSVGITFLILIIIFVEIWKDILLSNTIKKYGKAFVDGRLQ